MCCVNSSSDQQSNTWAWLILRWLFLQNIKYLLTHFFCKIEIELISSGMITFCWKLKMRILSVHKSFKTYQVDCSWTFTFAQGHYFKRPLQLNPWWGSKAPFKSNIPDPETHTQGDIFWRTNQLLRMRDIFLYFQKWGRRPLPIVKIGKLFFGIFICEGRRRGPIGKIVLARCCGLFCLGAVPLWSNRWYLCHPTSL